MRILVVPFLIFFVFPVPSAAQSGRIASDKKTIEIRATDRVSSQAEVATVRVGFQNVAPTKDAVYDENVRSANKIVQALRAAGTPAEAIETDSIKLEREDTAQGITPTSTRYSAEQDWRIRVKASEAQKIVDVAVSAGANQVGGVEWNVSDPEALEAKAYGAALTRAKRIAEQTAAQAGVKLGEILSISNSVSPFAQVYRGVNTMSAMIGVSPSTVTSLKLFPEDVVREASVTVVYAIAP
jgi:uncharacterized protein YggE